MNGDPVWNENTRYRFGMVRARDGDNCHVCGLPVPVRVRQHERYLTATLDHLVPRTHGGRDRLDNLRLAHQMCNSARGSDNGRAFVAAGSTTDRSRGKWRSPVGRALVAALETTV